MGLALALLLSIVFLHPFFLETKTYYVHSSTEPFPVGVDPVSKTITEQAIALRASDDNHLADTSTMWRWFEKSLAVVHTSDTFQWLASPVGRILVVWPGERTAEVAENIGIVLGWTSAERTDFIKLTQEHTLGFADGTIVPGQYVTARDASPAVVVAQLQHHHQAAVMDRYPTQLADILPLADVLIIASLIEREASQFENMRQVSGVIWNRLFIDMPLQLDASLQYVKAEQGRSGGWWPAVSPEDKFVDSPFNTYQHTGLPPAPIANPSVAAIAAALNPRATECFYYFHDAAGGYHCSVSYDEHVAKLRATYGQGS